MGSDKLAENGWIKLHRSLQDCWIWLDEEPFDKRSAWIDLLLTANHADKKILFNGNLITVERGQILTSIRKLSEKWKWSYDKTRRFLQLIEKDGMVQRESDNFRTLLTIVKYEVFQDVPITNQSRISEGISEQASERTSERSSDKQECKELKNVKNNTMSISAINALFEELWLLYPRKKGKGQISDARKRKVAEVGKEQMIRAIERYKRYVSTQKDLSYQYGSTFFNSGYIDYLDGNYVEREEVPKNTLGTDFNNFEGRSYDIGSLEQQLLNRK